MAEESQIHILAAEMVAAVADWLQQVQEKKGKALAEVVSRTTLQMGIYHLIHLQVDRNKLMLSTWISDFGSPEYEQPISPLDPPLTRRQAETELIPLVAEGIGAKLKPYEDGPLLDYQVQVSLQLADADILPVLHHVNERKHSQLLDRVRAYIAKLETQSYLTDPLDSFFLAQHLVDPLLFPEIDSTYVLRIYELVMERNRENSDKLREHRGQFIRAFTAWVEEKFLPTYYHQDKPKWGTATYTLKADVDRSTLKREHLELVLQTAILIIKYESNYSRQRGLDLLERLQELGYAKAA